MPPRRRAVIEDSEDGSNDEEQPLAAAAEQLLAAAAIDGGVDEDEDVFAGLVQLNEAEDEESEEDVDAQLARWEAEDAQRNKRVDKRVRKTDRKNPAGDWQPLPRGQGLTREQADERLAELSQVECMGGKWIGSTSETNGWKQRGQNSSRPHKIRVRPCPFFKESNCEARVREIKYADTDLIDLQRDTSKVHADHTISNRKVCRAALLCACCARLVTCARAVHRGGCRCTCSSSLRPLPRGRCRPRTDPQSHDADWVQILARMNKSSCLACPSG